MAGFELMKQVQVRMKHGKTHRTCWLPNIWKGHEIEVGDLIVLKHEDEDKQWRVLWKGTELLERSELLAKQADGWQVGGLG